MKELVLNNCRLDGRYDIREQLGRGSYAEVFLARDILASPESPHCQIVIKALNVFLQDDLDEGLERTLVENFQIEATALDRVRHPNIISRIGHGTARDLRGTIFHYLVLEYMSGGDLQSLLRKQKIPLRQSLNYVEQVCAGLGHAHNRGIIHRDIKPQNLLLTADLSTVKIADFGVARVHVSDSPITRVGTNMYAPPEHSPMSAGQTGTLAFAGLTPSADIYSLAKTTYTLLTGEAPRAFANEAVTDIPDGVRDEEWSGEFLRVLKKATSSDARERPQGVEEFWADLAAVRQIAADGEFGTILNAEISAPRPHVARGYSPLTPGRPSFEAVIENPADIIPPTRNSARPRADAHVAIPAAMNDFIQIDNAKAYVTAPPVIAHPVLKRKKGRAIYRFAVFILVVSLFTGLLYGTAVFMRGRGIFPEFRNPFGSRTAVASTDIYLRPSPNTDNDPIGLVTKNSKVRIVNSQNNWYQVDIVEQGRVRASQVNATRGWLNGKYLDMNSNQAW